MSTYEISKSSLLSLKAEILRKQEELTKAKADNDVKIRNLKKSAPLDLKNKGLEQRQLNDLSEEEENLLKKSREALIAKARVYDRLVDGKIGEEEAEFVERYLVRFDRKKSSLPDLPPDYRDDDVDRYRDSEEEGEIGPPYKPPKNRDEEWVEYVDCLGRSRMCLRKDLDYLKSKDKDLELIVEEKKRNREKSPTPPPKAPTPPPPSEDSELLSHDMRKELLRQKWEKEEEELAKKSDIHYQDILFDEARSHGVGYYGFSKDEETRKKQQDALHKLRQETKQEQQKSKNLKEMREKQLAARVRAAENRKRARMGLPPILTDEPPPRPVPEEPIAKEVDTEQKAHEKMLEDLRKKHIRPWDKGKVRKEHYEYSQEEWVSKKRRERPEEFAPPRQFNAAPRIIKDISSDEERSFKKPITKRKEFRARPIVNELSSSDEEEENRRGGRTEIAPPANYETETKRFRSNNSDAQSVGDSIAAGLKFLREQLEKKETRRRRDDDMFLS